MLRVSTRLQALVSHRREPLLSVTNWRTNNYNEITEHINNRGYIQVVVRWFRHIHAKPLLNYGHVQALHADCP